MPPPETNKVLTPREKALLQKWIDDGAEWKEYWAFIPPTEAKNDQQVGHPVDFFIDQKIDENRLQKSGEADAGTLIRRLSYLLTGLPPDVTTIEQFGELGADAYLNLIDTILDQPQFGERWARHWMDLMRYAEGRGHEFDYPILGAWRYRDYLIRAFNEDVPYDVLITEHLAGDLVEEPRRHPAERFNESVLGTGFYPMGEGKHSPVDSKEEESIRIDNIIDVTSKTFQGMTVACAKCHDHKFDPIPTTDYYALYGIFESTRFHNMSVGQTPELQAKVDSIDQLKKEIHLFVDRQLSDQIGTKGTPAALAGAGVESSAEVVPIGDFTETFGNWFSDGLAFGQSSTKGDISLDRNQLSIRESGTASSLQYGSSVMGALRSRTFILEKPILTVRARGNKSTIRIILDNHQLVQNPIHGELQRIIENDALENHQFDVEMWLGSKVYLEFFPGEYYVKNGKGHHFKIEDDAWIEVQYAWAADTMLSTIPAMFGVTKKPNKVEVSPADFQMVAQQFKHMEALKKSVVDTLFLAGVADGDAIESPVFIRGTHRQLSEEKVPHRFFTALGGEDQVFSPQGSGRLELAQAIADPSNPLTARVMVNRIWHHLFGRGIVETVDNFGLQGSIPSHPLLLDHLALKFVEDGWSIKKMIRYIVSSEAFKRSTLVVEENLEVDPTNAFLHHFPIRRLEAEAIRDGVLAASGSLDRTLYGPSIPLHLTEFLRGRGRPPASGPLDGYGRRSLYMQLLRNFLPPMMLAFDMPMPFSTFGRRNVTNVPAQSLTLLNDPFVQDQASRWAQSIDREDFDQAVKEIYLSAFSRIPTSAEIENAKQFFIDQKEIYLHEGETPSDDTLWTDFCHSVFNMKEFIYLL